MFDQNTRFRHGGNAERLAVEHKPEQVRAIMDLPYTDDSHELHRLDIYRPDAPEPSEPPLSGRPDQRDPRVGDHLRELADRVPRLIVPIL